MKVYIGFDSRQSFIEKFDKVVNAPYEVCEYSIKKHNPHIEVEPIILSELVDRGCYYRDVDPLASTEFTYSRFLVPFLNDYKGIAVFCDSDFLWNCNVEELLEFYDDTDAVSCVQHDYTPNTTTKMDGLQQTTYPRKNWSSLMMFNCEHPDTQKLSVEVVNTESPKYLHRMSWASSIGSIPLTYNYLEGDYKYMENPKVVHFTNGGPWHETWEGDYGDDWIKVYNEIKG
jgi:hypothetical protein